MGGFFSATRDYSLDPGRHRSDEWWCHETHDQEDDATPAAHLARIRFELKPDTELGLAILVIEYERGAYEPLGVVVSISEAQEIAACEFRARMRRLDAGEDVELPACYKLWAQGLEGRHLTVPHLIDPTQ